MDEDRRERIRYYTFAAFVGVLLLANWLGVFRTIFGLDTAIVVTLLAGYKTFYNSISALLERPRLGGHRVVHRGDRGAFGGTIPGRGGGHVHRAGGRGAGIVRGTDLTPSVMRHSTRCIILQYAHQDSACRSASVVRFAALRADWLVSAVPARETGGAQSPAVGGRPCRGHRRRVDPAGGDRGAFRQGAGTRQVHAGGDGETRAER